MNGATNGAHEDPAASLIAAGANPRTGQFALKNLALPTVSPSYLFVGVVLAITSVAPAHAQGMCVAGSDAMTREVRDSAITEENNNLDWENRYQKLLLKTASPDARRMMAGRWPSVRNEIYNQSMNPGVTFPFVRDSVTARIKELCKPGTKILIGGLQYSAFAAGELCDFGKSMIVFNSSVICVIRE